MTGYTSPDGIPYPDDRDAVADLVVDLEALAQGAQTATNNARAASAPAAHGHSGYAPTSHTHPYAPASHTHTPAEAGIATRIHGPWTVAGNSTAGPFTVPHGLGRTPAMIATEVTDDNGVMSVAASIRGWDATNVTILLRNFNASTSETVRVGTIAVAP
jgi:hypothetical protein